MNIHPLRSWLYATKQICLEKNKHVKWKLRLSQQLSEYLLHLELRLCWVTADAPEDEGDLPDADHAVLVRVVPEHKQEKPYSIICRMTMFNVGTTSRE